MAVVTPTNNEPLELIQNDNGVVFNITLRDGIYGNILDLTGFTVRVNFNRGVDTVSDDCTILDPAYGRIEYVFKPGVLSVPDQTYVAEFELRGEDGTEITTADTIEFFVRPEIDKTVSAASVGRRRIYE